MVTIIDYGMGNIGTVVNIFEKMDVPVQVTSNPVEVPYDGSSYE
jgi:imidazoleglycerol phosphate synthase glutamine amidotransferase subunit HisH